MQGKGLGARNEKLLPAAKVYCQPSHGKDGHAPEDFHKGFVPLDMGPAMKAGAVTKGREHVHSEIYRNIDQLGLEPVLRRRTKSMAISLFSFRKI